ncbi:sensor histidine kinase [Spirillospora sp. NPDC050679]
MREQQRERGRLLGARACGSVRGRATVITVGVAGVIMAVCLALVVRLLEGSGRDQADQVVSATMQRVVHDMAVEGEPAPVRPGPGEARLIQVVGPDGRVRAASPELAGDPPLGPALRPGEQRMTGDRRCPPFLERCVQLLGIQLHGPPRLLGTTIYVAEPVSWPLRMPLLVAETAAALLALLALIGWWTWRTIGRALGPVEAIRRRMAEITATDLDQRVPEPRTGGEIQELAVTVNDTLARLEEATERERRFVSDASHDLRNPVAGLLTRMEVALDEPDGFDLRPTVRAALRDTERLHDLVEDLLELSRLDARTSVPTERLDLAELVGREVSRRVERVPTTTRLADGAVVVAHGRRLGRVLDNLLTNAERHAESAVEVEVAAEGGEAVMKVCDDGDGVPIEFRERVFERFARLPESQRRDSGGTGLGLSIAREIAETYGGSLRIVDHPKGACFVLRLPLASGEA